jgi:hypothetical protein
MLDLTQYGAIITLTMAPSCARFARKRGITMQRAKGYEIPCSPWTAECLGALFTNTYNGRRVLHYWGGYLWWIQ